MLAFDVVDNDNGEAGSTGWRLSLLATMNKVNQYNECCLYVTPLLSHFAVEPAHHCSSMQVARTLGDLS